MMGWCVVAIPESGDMTWKVSSEKVPHMTLLFLGEHTDPEIARNIALQIQHTIKTGLRPFSAQVHSRGVLGEDKADVLFFDQAVLDKQIYDFRSMLLQDATIRRCYDSSPQYPSWTPHLTLGYPQKPAKKISEDWSPNGIEYVYFNKIAFWLGDSDGPEFKLDYRDRTLADADLGAVTDYTDQQDIAPEMYMSDRTKEFLMHKAPPLKLGYGSYEARFSHPVQDVIEDALDMTLEHAETAVLQHSDATDPRYIEKNQNVLAHSIAEAVKGLVPKDAKLRHTVATKPNGDWIVSTVDRMAHTASVETLVRPYFDEQGVIVDYAVVPGDASQQDMTRAMMHYGVKGMKWGVRRKSKDSSGAKEVSPRKAAKAQAKADRAAENAAAKTARAEQRSAVSKIRRDAKKTPFDEKLSRPVTTDAAKAEASRSRTKKHGTDALSNKELQALVKRMNLEQQYANLKDNEKASSARSAGRRYVADIFKDAARDLAMEAIKYAATEGAKNAYGRAQSARSERSSRSTSTVRVVEPRALPAGRRRLGR